MFYFSAEKIGFFAATDRDAHGNGWPDDAVEIREDVYASYALSVAPDGKRLGSEEGRPAWVSRDVSEATPVSKRDLALSEMVHDFGDGRVIQVRPIDEANLRNAIERVSRLSNEPIDWLMADNTKHPVYLAELQEALNSGQDQASAVWYQYFIDLGL